MTAQVNNCHTSANRWSVGRAALCSLTAAVGLVLALCSGTPKRACAGEGGAGAHVAALSSVSSTGVTAKFETGRFIEAAALAATGPSLEQRLRVGSRGLFRSIRALLRHVSRFLLITLTSWVNLTGQIVGFAAVALLVPLMDRRLLAIWRQKGFGATRAAAMLAVVVYLRLLFDRRTPVIGKSLMALALLYTISPGDLVPDAFVPIGFVDDFVAVVLASGCFIAICPDRLVEENAVKATRTWRRIRRRRTVRGDIVDLEIERRRPRC